MKKLMLSLFVTLIAVSAYGARYEFDESFTMINDEYTFTTSFREHTELNMIDLDTGMSYMQKEGEDIFKAGMDVSFKFWRSGHPFAFFSFDDSLDYKRIGAGYEHILRAYKNKAGYKVFDHKISAAAVYDSLSDKTVASGRYKMKVSVPRSANSIREMVGINGLVQIDGFGEKYRLDAEYRMNEQLSIFADYTNERVKSNRDTVIKQGIRVRI